MATYHKRNLNATAFDPLLFDDVYPSPIIGTRAPTTNDKAEFGTIWINKSANAVYIITSITANAANWANLSGGAGTFTSVTATTGNITATLGDIEAAAATKGFICGSGLKVIDGADSPDTVVTAPKGSLFLRTNGTGVADRAYINTDGATAWTAISTAS